MHGPQIALWQDTLFRGRSTELIRCTYQEIHAARHSHTYICVAPSHTCFFFLCRSILLYLFLSMVLDLWIALLSTILYLFLFPLYSISSVHFGGLLATPCPHVCVFLLFKISFKHSWRNTSILMSHKKSQIPTLFQLLKFFIVCIKYFTPFKFLLPYL